MIKRAPKTLMLLGGLAVAAATVTIPTTAEAQTIVVSSADYEPMYYDGYVVYFDDWGRPFIYVNGVAVYIPTSYAYYASYVNHYRLYRTRYHSWYRSHGARYRWYRSPYHRGNAIYHRSPGYRQPTVTHRSPGYRQPSVTHRAPSRGTRSAPARSSGGRGHRR